MKKTFLSVLVAVLALWAVEVTAMEPLRLMPVSRDATRVADWQADLRYLKTAISDRHGIYQDNEWVWLQADLFDDDKEARWGGWVDQPFNQRRRAQFEAELEALIAQVPTLSDLAIGFGISRAIASLGDSHFRPLDRLLHSHFIPLEIKSFINDGVQGYFIISTEPAFGQWVNHELIAIDGLSVPELETAFARYYAFENVYDQRRGMAQRGLVSVRWFEYMGLLDDGEVVMTVSDGVNETQVVFDASHWVTYPPGREAVGSQWAVHGRQPGTLPEVYTLQNEILRFHAETGILQVLMNDNWLGSGFMETLRLAAAAGFGYTLSDGVAYALGMEILEAPTGYLPRFLAWWEQLTQEVAAGTVTFEGLIRPHFDLPPFWHESSRGHGLARLTGWPVTPKVTDMLATYDIRAIVIDNRYNRGGNHGMFTALWDTLMAAVPVEYVFVTINNYSYSAGTMAPMALAGRGATVIGEPVSQNAIFYGLGGSGKTNDRIELPHSDLHFFAPNVVAHIHERNLGRAGFGSFEAVDRWIVRSPDWEWYTFRPDVLIELSLNDWITNHDPVMAYVASRVTS